CLTQVLTTTAVLIVDDVDGGRSGGERRHAQVVAGVRLLGINLSKGVGSAGGSIPEWAAGLGLEEARLNVVVSAQFKRLIRAHEVEDRWVGTAGYRHPS